MPRFPLAIRALALALVAVAFTSVASAQSHEERARTILQLFDTGQKDSAYQLIEPLKREARFVPAVIYTRAQMTPDDRALNLYREIIALEPGGGFADDAAHQLVRRYIDKRDSAAAHLWAGVLRTNYPRSPFIAISDDLLRAVTAWEIEDDPDGPVLAENAPEEPRAASKPATKATTKADAKPKTDAKPKEESKADETYSASGMRGYAVQVGLFPTKAAAEKRAAELGRRKLKAVALPKTVEGKKHYALVVGPYKSIDEAGKKKTAIASGCDCAAFIVRVE